MTVSKTLYSATMSLDGFIAGPGGDMSWATRFIGPNPTVEEIPAQIGALLVGKRTFTGDDPNRGREGEGEAFGGGWSGPQFVVSHDPPGAEVPDVTFVDDLDRAHQLAKASAGGKYVNVLGADIARQLLAARKVDELMVCIAPILLGDGVRLFDAPGSSPVKLERTRLTHTPLSTNTWFRVVR
jgi:dihydrofolate reductase